jgi:hypothetical protein
LGYPSGPSLREKGLVGYPSFPAWPWPSRTIWWDIPPPCLRFHPQLEETATPGQVIPLILFTGYFSNIRFSDIAFVEDVYSLRLLEDCKEDWEDSPVLRWGIVRRTGRILRSCVVVFFLFPLFFVGDDLICVFSQLL